MQNLNRVDKKKKQKSAVVNKEPRSLNIFLLYITVTLNHAPKTYRTQ